MHLAIQFGCSSTFSNKWGEPQDSSSQRKLDCKHLDSMIVAKEQENQQELSSVTLRNEDYPAWLALKQRGKSEEGSIAPLVLGFFVILMSAVYLVSDLSAFYIDRRDLISETEAILYKAAQQLDEIGYYTGQSRYSKKFSLKEGPRNTVPIDCVKAETYFRVNLGVGIEILQFSCNGEELQAAVERQTVLPFQLKAFSITRFTNRIEAAAISEYLR